MIVIGDTQMLFIGDPEIIIILEKINWHNYYITSNSGFEPF